MNSNGRAKSSGAVLKLPASHDHATSRTPALAKRLYTAKEAGIYLGGKSAWTVRELMWQGELSYVQTGKRRIMFDVHDLDRFVEERKTREQTH